MSEGRSPAHRPVEPRVPSPPAPGTRGRGSDALMRVAAAVASAAARAPAGAGKVPVGAPDAPQEAAADAMATRATNPASPSIPVEARAPAFASRPARALGADAGEPLAAAERERLEPRLGRDLSAVRVHEGPAAERAARGVGARAFALGPDVFLGAGARTAADGDHVLAHELAHAASDEGSEGPVLRRMTLAAFRAGLEATSADHKKAITELFSHPKFVPIITFLDRCPAGALDFFVGHVTEVVGGKTVELFGGFSPGAPGELSVNPFRAEHASNPLEMVDTIVHEAIHAIVSLAGTCASASNPNPLTGTGITDSPADPELTGYFATGRRDSRTEVAAASAAGIKTTSGGNLLEYFDRNYGPSASRPETHYIDLNRKGLELVTSIITDIHAKLPTIGRETVSFDNVEMFRAEALIPTRPWLNPTQFGYSKGLFKDRVAKERKVDPATYTDREYTISAIQVVESADSRHFDPNTAGGWGPVGGVWECLKASRFTGKQLKTVVTGSAGSPPGGGTAYKIIQHL